MFTCAIVRKPGESIVNGITSSPVMESDAYSSNGLWIKVLIPAGFDTDKGKGVEIGYWRDASQPGGGIVLFRKSYGATPDFTGYQAQTFEYVMRTVNDAEPCFLDYVLPIIK